MPWPHLPSSSSCALPGCLSLCSVTFFHHRPWKLNTWLVVEPPLWNILVSWDDCSRFFGEKTCSKPPTRILNDQCLAVRLADDFQRMNKKLGISEQSGNSWVEKCSPLAHPSSTWSHRTVAPTMPHGDGRWRLVAVFVFGQWITSILQDWLGTTVFR